MTMCVKCGKAEYEVHNCLPPSPSWFRCPNCGFTGVAPYSGR